MESWAKQLLEAGAVKSFVPLLKSHDGEEIHVALTFLEAMFRVLVSGDVS